MKAVFLATVGLLLAINAQAQNCPSPSYTQDVVPVCQPNLRIKLPSYSDPSSFYSCTTGKPVLNTCQSPRNMFNYVKQECCTCEDYIPAVECSGLKIDVTCVDIASVTTSATTLTTAAGGSTATDKTTASGSTDSTTTAAGSSVTTAASTTQKSTTVKTTTTTAAPTTAGPTPPSDGDSTTSADSYVTGTTISVPNPPSPNEGPTPPGPEPTAPTLPDEPEDD